MTQRSESGQAEKLADECDAASCSEATRIVNLEWVINTPSVINHSKAPSLSSRPLRSTKGSRKPPVRSRRHPYRREDTTTGSCFAPPSRNDVTPTGLALIDTPERHVGIRDLSREQQSRIQDNAGDENATIQTRSPFHWDEQQAVQAQAGAIYANLGEAEKACKTPISQTSFLPQDSLTEKQLQHITSLHVNLLYWHHDFLVQAQYLPTISADFDAKTRSLLPRRMWNYGIQPFLDLLLHDTPALTT